MDETKIERPLDFLNQKKGEQILIMLNNGKEVMGKLLAFDIHINIVLMEMPKNGKEKMKFIRGDNINSIC